MHNPQCSAMIHPHPMPCPRPHTEFSPANFTTSAAGLSRRRKRLLCIRQSPKQPKKTAVPTSANTLSSSSSSSSELISLNCSCHGVYFWRAFGVNNTRKEACDVMPSRLEGARRTMMRSFCSYFLSFYLFISFDFIVSSLPLLETCGPSRIM